MWAIYRKKDDWIEAHMTRRLRLEVDIMREKMSDQAEEGDWPLMSHVAYLRVYYRLGLISFLSVGLVMAGENTAWPI
jgi:hypothetical protein